MYTDGPWQGISKGIRSSVIRTVTIVQISCCDGFTIIRGYPKAEVSPVNKSALVCFNMSPDLISRKIATGIKGDMGRTFGEPFEFSLNVFTEFAEFFDKNICHYSKRA